MKNLAVIQQCRLNFILTRSRMPLSEIDDFTGIVGRKLVAERDVIIVEMEGPFEHMNSDNTRFLMGKLKNVICG